MELETVNKLYLEISQVATAKTKRDSELDEANALLRGIAEFEWFEANAPATVELIREHLEKSCGR